MTGIDIPFPEIQGAIHQPTLLEISFIGEKDFSLALSLITIDKNKYFEDMPELLNQINNFQIFMEIIKEKEYNNEKEAVTNFLQLLFPAYTTMFTPYSIVLKDNENQIKVIDENNFEIFQEILKDMFCVNGDKEKQFNPKGELATKIAKKIEKMRAKIAKMKQEEKGGQHNTLSTYISCLSVGLKMPISQLTNMTVYQLYDLMKRMGLYLNWEIDIKVRLTPGAQANGEVEDWMKNIH